MTSYDYTAEVFALQNARGEMQAAKAKNRIEITAQYKARIDNAIKEADRAAELHFAKLLKEANEAGVPQSIIRRDVLRTNVWSRWTYWRDLAEITPDRVTLDNAKEERNKAYRWEEGEWYGQPRPVLVWLKDKKGKPLDKPINIINDPDYLDVPDWTEDDKTNAIAVFSNRKYLMELAQPIINERFKKED